MSHEITACRRKWQLMKSPRSRSHRRREPGSEILNTKSHFWFPSWVNFRTKLQNVPVRGYERDELWPNRRRTAVYGPGELTPGRAGGWGLNAGWGGGGGGSSVMMMWRCSAAAKMDWPKLGLIKSQGWLCSAADIINIKMIIAELNLSQTHHMTLENSHLHKD